jgi:hypothetical protein
MAEAFFNQICGKEFEAHNNGAPKCVHRPKLKRGNIFSTTC